MSSSTPERGANNPFRPKPRASSTAVQVLAVVHLIYGGLSFVVGLCSGVLQALGVQNLTPKMPAPPPGAPPFPTDLQDRILSFMDEALPYYRAYQMTQIVLWLILSLLLVAAGIGLLIRRPWGRKLSLAYGVLSLVVQLAGLVYVVAFVIPAMGDFYRQLEKEFPQMAFVFAASRVGQWMTPVVMPAGWIYPIVVLVLLTRPKVVAAFAGQPPVAEVERVEDRGAESSGAFTRDPFAG